MDCDGDPETVVDRSALLDNVMLYWLPRHRRVGRAAVLGEHRRRQRGALRRGAGPDRRPDRLQRLPAARLQRSSRRWAQRRFSDIRHWGEPPRGGHFAAFEQPALFARETQSAFRALAEQRRGPAAGGRGRGGRARERCRRVRPAPGSRRARPGRAGWGTRTRGSGPDPPSAPLLRAAGLTRVQFMRQASHHGVV